MFLPIDQVHTSIGDVKFVHIKSGCPSYLSYLDNVQIALEKSEILLKTFDDFLKASAAEKQGDYSLAVNYYARAADLGNVDAQYRLGTLYVSV